MKRQVVKEEILEMKWRCEVPDRWTGEPCGHENRGGDAMCAKCHHPRPEGDDIFYLPDDARVIRDGDERTRALRGPDWKCMSCGYDNTRDDVHCRHCGELRKEDEEQWLNMGGDRQSISYEAGGIAKSADEALRKRARRTVGAEGGDRVSPRRSGMAGVTKKAVLAAVAMIVVFAVWFFFFKTTQAEYEVAGFEWERRIAIEKAKTVVEQDWLVPSGGKIVSRSAEVHHYDQVIDGYKEVAQPVYENVEVGTETYECGTETLANGYVKVKYCERPLYERKQTRTDYVKEPVFKKVPVLRTWYGYEILRWFPDRTEVASGKDRNPAWPKHELKADEKIGGKKENYIVNLVAVNSGEKFQSVSYEMDEKSWKGIGKGNRFIAELTVSGTVKQLKSP